MRKVNLSPWLFALALFASLSPSKAHEFWVAPQNYSSSVGSQVVAALKVGQMMNGADYPYLPDRFQSFTITTRQGTRDAQGTLGDIPALAFVANEPGLNIIAFHSTPHRATFDTFAQFVDYLEYEGLGEIAQDHLTRGLSQSGIAERYIRCSKALVQVGPAEDHDTDKRTGMPFELVAQANPYADGLETLPLVLTLRGNPVAGRQIAVFRDNGEVSRTIVVTDTDGRAEISLAGGGEFLLNAVNIEPIEDHKAVWESHWASLTFGLPRDK